jgi:hypothetical protein
VPHLHPGPLVPAAPQVSAASGMHPPWCRQLAVELGRQTLATQQSPLSPLPACRIGVNRVQFLLESLADLDARWGGTRWPAVPHLQLPARPPILPPASLPAQTLQKLLATLRMHGSRP